MTEPITVSPLNLLEVLLEELNQDVFFLALPEVPVFLTGLKSVQVRQRKAQFWFNCRLHSPAEAKHIFTDGGFWKLSNMFLGFYLSSL